MIGPRATAGLPGLEHDRAPEEAPALEHDRAQERDHDHERKRRSDEPSDHAWTVLDQPSTASQRCGSGAVRELQTGTAASYLMAGEEST